MFLMAQHEKLKACTFFRDQLYINVRAEMGRVDSAQVEQCIPFLIAVIVMRIAAQEFQQKVQAGAVPETLT